MKILMFHRVLPDKQISNCPYFQRGTLIPLKFFSKVLETIEKKGYVVKTFEDALSSSNKQTIVLTFDDGYVDNFKFVVPLLNEYNWKASFYPILKNCIQQTVSPLDSYYSYVHNNIQGQQTKHDWIVGQRKKAFLKLTVKEQKKFITNLKIDSTYNSLPSYMTIENLITLKNDGHEIGGHSWEHPVYTNISTSEILSDFNKMTSTFSNLNIYPKTFAYPDGQYNERIIEIIQEAAYKGACTVSTSKNLGSPLFEITRHFVSPSFNINIL